jgi:hypothetical protein
MSKRFREGSDYFEDVPKNGMSKSKNSGRICEMMAQYCRMLLKVMESQL